MITLTASGCRYTPSAGGKNRVRIAVPFHRLQSARSRGCDASLRKVDAVELYTRPHHRYSAEIQQASIGDGRKKVFEGQLQRICQIARITTDKARPNSLKAGKTSHQLRSRSAV